MSGSASADDHSDVCLQIGQSKENKNEQSGTGVCYPRNWKLDHCVAHSLGVLLMPGPLSSKKTRTSLGRTGYPSAIGGSSNGLKRCARTFVTHERLSLACDLSSPPTPASELLQRTVTPMSGNVLQVPVGSWFADKQQSRTGGSKVPSPRSLAV